MFTIIFFSSHRQLTKCFTLSMYRFSNCKGAACLHKFLAFSFNSSMENWAWTKGKFLRGISFVKVSKSRTEHG